MNACSLLFYVWAGYHIEGEEKHDTVATITGAMVGAFVNPGDDRSRELFVKVQDANGFDLVGLASSLARVAHRRQ